HPHVLLLRDRGARFPVGDPPLPRVGGAVRRTASRQGADRGRPRLPLPQRTTFADRGNSGGVRSSRKYPPARIRAPATRAVIAWRLLGASRGSRQGVPS